MAIYRSEDMVIEMANDAMLSFWGKDKTVVGKPLQEALPEIVGQPFMELLLGVWRTGITHIGKGTPATLIKEGKEVTSFFDFEYRAIPDENGETCCIMNSATDVTDVVLSKEELRVAGAKINALISDTQKSNEALKSTNIALEASSKAAQGSEKKYRNAFREMRKSQEELQYAVDAAGMGTFDLNPSTGMFKSNQMTKKWFGLLPTEDLQLSDAINAIVPEDRERVSAAIAKTYDFSNGGEYEITYNISSKLYPEPRTLYARGKMLFGDEEQPVRFSGILMDVTEEAKDEKRKNDFIGMVSHELKTPLTTLSGYVQMLTMDTVIDNKDVMRSLAEKATNQVRKMSSMVNSFLTMGALDSGKIHLNLEIFDMYSLLQEIVTEVSTVADSHPLLLSNGCYMPVEADKQKIQTVVTNLLSNARKYSPAGENIQVICSQVGEEVQVSVIDHATGIPSEEKEKIFQRYQRIQDEHVSTTPGFGIGLYLSSEIIKEHNGKIWVDSDYGSGSNFTFSLPGIPT